MASPEITVAISGVAFGGVIGLLSGYSVRAYNLFPASPGTLAA